MLRFEVFMKGFLIGFCSCSILLFCLNFNIYCEHSVLQSRRSMKAEGFKNNADFHGHTKHYEDSESVQGLPDKAGSPNETRRTNKRGPRILCWVMTTQKNIMTKAIHVYDTWGKRCDKVLFFISTGQKPVTMGAKEFEEKMKVSEKQLAEDNGNKSDHNAIHKHRNKNRSDQKNWDRGDEIPPLYRNLPVVSLETVLEGRDHLTAKMMNAFIYIHHLYLDEYDWFLKADDDTYVIMENLRHFLSHQDKEALVYFGHHFVRLFFANGYNHGGSGYVLSRAALRRFGAGYSKSRECVLDGEDEDVDIGRCMQSLGVGIGNTADKTRAIRFVSFSMEEHFLTGLPYWTKTVDAYGAKTGIDSISRDVISFHYVHPWMMYALDYFVYRFKLRSEDEIVGE